MKYMEEHLNCPSHEVLQMMQDRILSESTYFGIKAIKSPTDFWVYQEIIFETRPDFIIEIGNYHGGSTLALAHLCDALGSGSVIGCDLAHEKVPTLVKEHPRITLVAGDACASFAEIKRMTGADAKVLVIEDSSHTYENTLAVLRTFSPLVKPGGYFIVEDGICHHGLPVGLKPGPYEAIETFLAENKYFEADRSKESFFLTWNPKGYLKRRSQKRTALPSFLRWFKTG